MFDKKSPMEKWKQLAEQTRKEAERLPPGRARDAMIRRAGQLDTACHTEQWMQSPGLRPPAPH